MLIFLDAFLFFSTCPGDIFITVTAGLEGEKSHIESITSIKFLLFWYEIFSGAMINTIIHTNNILEATQSSQQQVRKLEKQSVEQQKIINEMV